MYISPVSPSATGQECSSSRNISAPEMGNPMGMGVEMEAGMEPRGTVHQAASMVASVGP